MKCKLVNKPIYDNYLEELLRERGVTDIEAFLHPTKELLAAPELLIESDAGFQNIKLALDYKYEFEIALVVDCDVDGFTSATIIYQYLKELKPELKIIPYIHEHKQHGLEDTWEKISKTNAMLVICPDAATNDQELVKKLGEYGMNVLILDHHLKDDTTIFDNDNCVVINNQIAEEYQNKDLTGAGVTWQFCRYCDLRLGTNYADKYIDLAALGIVSDMGSYLSLENRYIIQEGLTHINNYFFKAACEKQSYSMGGKINYTNVAFYITPLLNSMIRVGTQPEKERLFQAFVDGHAMVPCHKRGAKGTMEEVAIESLRECTNTKAKQDKITNAAVEQLSIRIFNDNLLDNKLLLVELTDEDEFPQEVNGLVAMKLAAKYKHPTLLGRRGPDGKIKGSVRGINDGELESTRDFLLNTGLFDYCSGHDQAFGWGMSAKYVDKLLSLTNEQLRNYNFSEAYYDVNFERIAADNDLIELIEAIGDCPEIYGQNNKEPLIYIKDINITKSDIQVIGRNSDTLKFEKFGITYIKFFAKDMIEQLNQYNNIKIEVVGKANINEWGGRKTSQIMIENYEIKDNTFGF